jgi:hypothetical protein
MVIQLHAGLSLVFSNQNHNLPCSPLSRQDLVSWKMALDKRQLPEVDRNVRNEKNILSFIILSRNQLLILTLMLSLYLSRCSKHLVI